MYFNKTPIASNHNVNLNWCSKCMQQPINISSQLCENHLGTSLDRLSINPLPVAEPPKLSFDLLSKFEIDPSLILDTPSDQNIDVKSTTFEVSDMVYTEDDHLIICCSGTRVIQNKRVKTANEFVQYSQKLLKYGEKGKYVSQCPLEGKPRKICILPEGKEAVITLGNTIQFVNLSDFSLGRTMVIGSECSGITIFSQMIYIGDNTKLHVLDKIGRLLKSIESPCKMTAIHANIDGRFYCATGEALCCITQDGTLIYSYNSSDLGKPKSITSDKHGNVYVAGSELQMFYPYKSQVDRVLRKEDGVEFITAACFSHTFSKMFVANKDGKCINIYTCT